MIRKKRLLILIVMLVSVAFLGQQSFMYFTTGKSLIFTYKGSITPKDFGFILNEIHYHVFRLWLLNDEDGYPDTDTLCNAVDGIEPAEKQPLKDFLICIINNTETGKAYLYSEKAHKIIPQNLSQSISNNLVPILLVNKSLSEKPKGVYHSFKLDSKSNDWIGIATDGTRLIIDSPIPPIPGCFYSFEEKKVLVPIELLPAYKLIYPNLDIPKSSIMFYDYLRDKKASPSGLYYLEIDTNTDKTDLRTYLCIIIIVKQQDGKIVDKIQTTASSKMTWSVSWDSNDSILLDSSDIGDRRWKKTNDDHWRAI